MPTVHDIYRSKLMTAEQAYAGLPTKIGAVLGFFAAQPPTLIQALADAVEAERFDEVKLFYMHPTAATAKSLLRVELCDVLKLRPYFLGPGERALVKAGLELGKKAVYYVPMSFSDIPRHIREAVDVDVLPLQVSAMDRAGYFSLGLTGAYTEAAIAKAKRVVVETNPNMPRTFGAGASLHVSRVHGVVEADTPIPVAEPRAAGPLDDEIANHIVEMIPDRACLQFGVGGVPDMVARRLRDRKDLGVHTELMADGIASLLECGAVTNRFKTTDHGKTVFNVAIGSEGTYDLLHDNPTIECRPADYVNDPRVIGMNDDVISVNSMIEVDLFGQVNAEFLSEHQYSAPGGQLDFVRGASYSRRGKSIIAAYSTAAGGACSRIVARVQGPVTDPRTDVQYVATEYGVCELRGRTSTERALGLIDIAHPDFRAELLAAAKQMKLIV